MTMEHFAYPYLKDFFGADQVEKAKFAHLSGSLSTIPYLVSVTSSSTASMKNRR